MKSLMRWLRITIASLALGLLTYFAAYGPLYLLARLFAAPQASNWDQFVAYAPYIISGFIAGYFARQYIVLGFVYGALLASFILLVSWEIFYQLELTRGIILFQYPRLFRAGPFAPDTMPQSLSIMAGISGLIGSGIGLLKDRIAGQFEGRTS